MILEKYYNPLSFWRFFFNGEDISAGNCCGASEEEGWIERYVVTPEPPDMPERTETPTSCTVNWFKTKWGYMLSDAPTERVYGNVRLQLRSESEIRERQAQS